MNKRKKWILGGTAAAAAVFIIFGNPFSRKEAPGEGILTEKAKQGDLKYSISATGTIEPLRTYEIKSRASGTIIKMPVETGTLMRMGGLICQLDATDEKNNLEKAITELEVARQKLEKAKADLTRQEELYRNKFVASSTLEDYRLKLAVAKAEHVSARVNRDNAQRRFQDTYVTSPINGIILEKCVEPGQIISSGTATVTGGTKIATMADLSSVYIKAYVDETDIARVKLGLKAGIVVDAYSKEKFTGTVIKVEPKAIVEQSVTSFLVTTRIDNPQGLLKPGMNASVEILIEQVTNVTIIPYSAVKQLGRLSYVFVKNKDKIRVQMVRIGKSNVTEVVVLRGVRPGQEVVTSGLTKDQMQALLDDFRKQNGERKGRRQQGERQGGRRGRSRPGMMPPGM